MYKLLRVYSPKERFKTIKIYSFETCSIEDMLEVVQYLRSYSKIKILYNSAQDMYFNLENRSEDYQVNSLTKESSINKDIEMGCRIEAAIPFPLSDKFWENLVFDFCLRNKFILINYPNLLMHSEWEQLN